MTVRPLPADRALAELDRFDAVIDARSESEHALDHLPGALNWPSLDDAQRVQVGTLYKQVSPFEAQKIGAALVAANIAHHLHTHVQSLPKSWRPLVYCWRGGKRSNALAHVLGQIGFEVHLLEGGYKAFRQALVADLPARVAPLRFVVLCGPTGSGKTRLLQALAAQGEQVLDLEALACHRASVLGRVPGVPQPSQKAFETRVWQALRRFNAQRPVYVEAESKKVGNLTVPDALMAAMRLSPCVRLELPLPERVALLLEDYPHFVQAPAELGRELERLVDLRGRAVVSAWQAQADQGQLPAVVADLLSVHYDPGYLSSTRRNFERFEAALPLPLPGRSPSAMAQAAEQLRARTGEVL